MASRGRRTDEEEPEREDAALSHYRLQGPGGLFERIRRHVATDQGRGQVFERLVKAFLTEDPVFSARFSRVWLWAEWPGRNNHGDTGIDLVAEERDGGVCAIQCKFYAEDTTISKADIDGFLAASGKAPFTSRLFVSSTERWGKNAEAIIADQHIPVQRLGVADFEASPFDWSRFDPAHPDQLPKRQPREARPHQLEAIADVKAGLEKHGKGVLVMACGTGKTLTALRLAEEVVSPGGAVLYCVPSISLLSQTLRAWSSDAKRPLHALAVCSDAQVTRDSEDIHVYDLALPATTDPQILVERFNLARGRAKAQSDGLVVVFSTYQSLERVVEAQELGLAVFDLIVADEAHRTTGALAAEEPLANFTLVHDADRLRGARRLYMTATPRIYAELVKRKAETEQVTLCSMDDEALYGP
ncbi:DEAD/DEAH box helicase family protein, partial [Aciditerrimonas ferrireducens]